MPVTLRKRPQCHYCGKRLNTAKRVGNRVPCDQCSADNYFDANNNITDVPEYEVNRLNLHSRVSEVESESDVFCQKCLTNQAFYIQALANYLPDESDAHYEKLFKELPEYKRTLELRYPQCCVECEPKAATRIQEANYMAKSDHLRRVLHRHHDQSRLPRSSFSSLLISAAGLGYGASLGIQLTWHALSSQMDTQHILPGTTPLRCFTQWPIPAQCTHYVASFLPVSLFIGLLCIWWNPKWQSKLQGKEGRLVGLSKYYQIQLALMGLRFFAWAVVQDLPSLRQNVNAVHTVLFVLLSTISVYALVCVVVIDNTPLVDWQRVQPPLVRPDQFRPPTRQLYSPPSSQGVPNFNVADLGSDSTPLYEPWRPPTPPTEDDSMDWTPTAHNFNPQPRPRRQKFEQKNPFYGTLPAAPARGSLNPKAPPPPPPRRALGIPPGFFGLSKSRDGDQAADKPHSTTSDVFAPTKFFPNTREADTGLESIFAKVFSVQDPTEGSVSHNDSLSNALDMSSSPRRDHGQRKRSLSQSQMQTANAAQPPTRIILSCVIAVTLGMIASSILSFQHINGAVTNTPSRVLPYLALVPTVHLLEEFYYTGQIELASMIASAPFLSIAGAGCIYLPQEGSASVRMWNRIAIGTVLVLMAIEVYRLCQLQSAALQPPHASPATSNGEYAPQSNQLSQQQHVEAPVVPHPPPQPQALQPRAFRGGPFANTGHGTIRKRDSNESISSVSSINTTSTASGWKTPQTPSRTYDWQQHGMNTARSRGSNSLGFGSLSLGNDFGSAANIAGPRNRQTPGNGMGRYR